MNGPQIHGRVLIAEDDDLVRRVMCRTLRRAGYEVVVAADGEEALEHLTTTPCDVLVSDLVMPRRDGMNLLRRIRAMELDVPVVLMSGYAADTAVAVEALERGVLSYLCKPFKPDELAAAVERALQRHQSTHDEVRELLDEQAAFDRMLSTVHVHRQPIVCWSERRVLGYECLLRAEEPSLPHPGAILEAAERLGRLHELGRTVRACCSELPAGEAPADTLVFVNLHPHDLLDEQLYDPRSPLGAIAHRVVLEVTERARLEELAAVRSSGARLREMGYRIAIDDIGSGFAGLSSVTVLEPDVVKLDMSLVREVHRSRVKRQLVDTLVRVCDELSIAVIAEGVETAAELAVLLELGCDSFQGYLFAKPGLGHPAPDWNVSS